MTKQQITKKFAALGMAWAVRSDKFQDVNDDKAYYHVHPDASYPHQNSIKRFDNLDEVAEYVKAREAAAAANTIGERIKIMERYEESRWQNASQEGGESLSLMNQR